MNVFEPSVAAVVALLVENQLPTEDIGSSATQHFLGCGESQYPDGVVGLEIHDNYALLRSLAVRANCRGKGVGQALVAAVETLAQSKQLQAIYLLTTTAADFFSRLDYEVVARESVATPITKTAEFTSLCPDDAIVMRKALPR